jgi:hypothetical protein
MVKLRAVKDRTHNSEEGSDLRQLGLHNNGPWVFLSTTAATIDVEKVCVAFGLTHKKGKDKNVIHIYKPGLHRSHKEKTLELFFAGTMLLNLAPSSTNLLGQLSVLAEQIKSGNNVEPVEEQSSDYQNWKRSNGNMNLPEHIRLYLSHAGIEVRKDMVDLNFAHEFLEKEKTLVQEMKKVSSK